jgi:hypothetical protein
MMTRGAGSPGCPGTMFCVVIPQSVSKNLFAATEKSCINTKILSE